MRLRDYLSSKMITLCFIGIGALLLIILLLLIDARIATIIISIALLLVTIVAWLLCSWYIERKKLLNLERIMEALPEKHLLAELLPPPSNAVEKKYYDIMKAVSRSAIGIVEQYRQDKEEYCEYVESWVHEIKTPLTACSLILSNDGDVRKLKRELKRADNLTESILYYARLKTVAKDTIIKKINVASVIDESIKSQMELLMAASIGVSVTGDFVVHTDPKLLTFIVKQLLINSAKYCPRCHIAITVEGGVITLEDNGIGIPSQDIPRVTERGFTGTNGRKLGTSTGMGLYIVKELCSQLGITLFIDSEVGKFTRIKLSFDSLTKL